MANLPGGKNQTRKVYGYIRAPRQEIFVIINDVTRSLNAQALSYHRDFFRVINDSLSSITASSVVEYGQYDEDLVSFNWQTSATKNFNISFSSTPIVVLEVVPNENLENINVFIDSLSATQFTVNTSAPFSGSIHYRAIYAATYPTIVQRNILSSSYFYTQVAAGYIDLNGNNYFTASYPSLGSTPTSAWFTPYDINNNDDANVVLVNSSSYGLTSTTGDISSAIVNRINFLVVV